MIAITQEALAAAGWERGGLNGGDLVEFWRTYKPCWTDWLRQRDNSIRVRFPDDAFGTAAFMVWLIVGRSMTPVPAVQTIEQLTTLLELMTDTGRMK